MKEAEMIYTSLDDAKIAIQQRWHNKKLRTEIEIFLGEDITHLFAQGPRAITQQYVITSGHDTGLFVQMAQKTGLKPLCLEFTKDKFVAKNIQKYLLGKLYFSDEFGLENFANIPYAQIINYNTEEGKPLCDVKTLWGQTLVEFHHDMTEMTIPELKGNIYDFSEWFYRTRHLSDHYYLYYLSLFICHGIIFENYEIEGGDGKFVRDILLPSFAAVEEKFGVKPLICKLVPSESLDDLFWWCGAKSQADVIRRYTKEKFDYDIHIK